VFKSLNDELMKINTALDLVCAGGYVMQLHGYRATMDVDAFYENSSEIEEAIKKVGIKHKINKRDELWLNNSIANMNPQPPDDYCEIIHAFSNLSVKAVGIKYLIGMKITSGREQDLLDVADILKHDNNETPFELLTTINKMGFVIDISVLLDVYGEAHGIEWLDEFYLKNEKKLREYF